MERTSEDEIQQYSCGVCGAKNLIPDEENEIDHECLNGLSVSVDTNFVMRPRIVDPETGYLVSDGNGEREKMAEDINECINKVNEHCGNSTKQKTFSVLEKSRCKKKFKTGEVDNVWTSESIAHLIQLVKNNKIIWNYCIPMKERSKFKISIAWDFIVEDLKDTFPDFSSFFNPIVAQSKWKSLVDYFWRKVAPRPKTTGSAAAAPESWLYFENMTFLQEIQTKQKQTIDNFPEEDEENRTNEKIRRGRTNKNNNGIEKIASALTELAKAPSIIPPPLPAPLPQNTTQSKLTFKEKKIRDFLQLMESLMLSIPDADLDNVLFSIHETVHKAKK